MPSRNETRDIITGGDKPLPYINSETLPERKHLRYRKHDYSSFGGYFITICSHKKQWLFSFIDGEGENAKVRLTRVGIIMDAGLHEIPKRFTSVEIDKYVIMPNHIHMILLLNPTEEGATPPSVPQIIGAFKSVTANQCRKELSISPIFQRSYYDHIIRDREDYFDILRYIEYNPHNWSVDQHFTP